MSDNPTRIAIQGQKNSYHHQALIKLSQANDLSAPMLVPIYCSSFEEAFSEVESGRAEYALLAIENGVHGHIYQTLDIIMQKRAQIVAETYLPIHHQLAGLTSDINLITDIYSHFAAFPQCSKFLESELPNAHHHVFEDTAAAAEMIKISGDTTKAAICSEAAASDNHLQIITKNIENFNDNVTRFFLLAKKGSAQAGLGKALTSRRTGKTSLILTTSHKPGSLFRALEVFYKNDLNLSVLTSRPGEGGTINYRFYIEIEAAEESANFSKAIEKIRGSELGRIDILGSY